MIDVISYNSQNLSQNVTQIRETAEYLNVSNLIPGSFKDKAGHVKLDQVILAINAGARIGLDPIASVNSIDIIDGRVCIQSRMLTGLLASKGIAIEIIKDYEPVIKKTKSVRMVKDAEGNPTPMIDEITGHIKYYLDHDGLPLEKEKIVDLVSTLRFTRDYGGNVGVKSTEVSVYWSDVQKAGWDTKSNWTKLP